ncbi:isochorismatase family protein [Pokkaliibacter sp. CJK22405]|uniref:isochorismatase family protein n=1 Tax=Pokkaliibacter sp. CJK22405 TaxID=3384615 RepID=UPI0039855312
MPSSATSARQPLSLDYSATAVVVIDLQFSNAARELAPHDAATVIRNSRAVTDALRAKGATILFVRVDPTKFRAMNTDASLPRPQGNMGETPFALVPDCGVEDGDEVIVKRQIGAFYGTPLEQVLRRNGITTVIMTGIATNIGVESTARQAADLGFDVVFIEDAMSTMSEAAHRQSVEGYFPYMGRVRTTEALLEEVAQG